MSDPIVGIDLGTSNTVVAYAEATGVVRVLADEAGHKIHPSVVSFHPSGGVVVGAAAKQRKVIDPKNTIYSVKRLIGRRYSAPEVATAQQRMPFEIKEGANQAPVVVTRGGEFAIPEISAIVLDHMRNVAASALGCEVRRAVVTVPASFNDAQRSATATAGSIAGLTIVRVLNEPTAAALAYGASRDLHSTIAVYDFGGGTFDITILKLRDQVYEVLGTAGDTFLGGDDLDERLVDRMVNKFLTEQRIDLRTNEVSMMRLRAVAEQTKIELSRRSRAVVRVDEIAYGPDGKPLDLQIEITRDEFVRQVADIIDKTFPVCQEALDVAGLTTDRIDDIILVGGTTKIPYVRDQVSKFFAKAPRTDVNPEEAVAMGAALQATSLERILGRKSSRHPSASEPEDTKTETNTLSESSLTDPDPILPPISDELELMPPPPRKTAGYNVTVPKRPTTERPVEKGQAVDRVAGGGPPAQNQPIGRLKSADPRADLRKTQMGVPAGLSPPPLPRPPVPPSRRTGPAPAVPTSRVTDRSSPVPMVPAAPPQAKTLIAEPQPRAASTASTVVVDPLAGDSLADTNDAMTPASTAKGFPPPQPPPIALPPTSRGPVVMDVTPRGLGIGTVAGYCEELIRRNSRVPTETRKLFTTSRDAQDVVRIIVCQGESRRLDNNVVIGDLVLENLPRRPRGETSIEVTFMLDASGILQVRARDAQTGAEQRASLDVVGTMPEGEVAASRDRLQQLRR